MKIKSIWDITRAFNIDSSEINFVKSDRINLLVYTFNKEHNHLIQNISIYISPEYLKILEGPNYARDVFRMAYECPGILLNEIEKYSVQIVPFDEISEYERKYECHTLEKIKNDFGIQNFTFKKPSSTNFNGELPNNKNPNEPKPPSTLLNHFQMSFIKH